MSTNAAEHYRQQQILNSSPAERVVLLYDGAIRFMMLALQAIKDEDIQKRFDNSTKARNIIVHLLDTLEMDKGGEVAINLDRIYRHLLATLPEIDKNNSEAAEEIINHLKTLRASWAKIAQNEKEGKPLNTNGDIIA